MELDLELDVIDREPTVLEYARFHGLCSDYTKELSLSEGIAPISDETFDLDFQDYEHDPKFTDLAVQLTKERLTVSKEAAMLLKSVTSLQEDPPAFYIPEGMKRIRGLKQELPILQTDNELDMLKFGSGVEEPSLAEMNIPLEPLDEEDGEDMEWLVKYTPFPEQCNERLQNEKFEVSKDTLVYLQSLIKTIHLSEDPYSVDEEIVKHRKKTAVRPVTPPLLPWSPPPIPYVPSSPGNEVQFASEDSNSGAEEAKMLENQIMTADSLVRHDSNGSDVMLMDMFDLDELEEFPSDPSSPRVKRKASDLKVEGPLTPEMFSEPPAKKLKTVTFADMLVEYIPMDTWDDSEDDGPKKVSRYNLQDPELPSTFENGNSILCTEDDYVFYKEVFVSKAKEVNRKLANEKLLDADANKRCDVPWVDFELPTAPWEEFARNPRNPYETEIHAQSRLIQSVKRDDLKEETSWHGSVELERKLPFAPFFKQFEKVCIEEKLDGEDVLDRMLAEPTTDEIATSSTDMWKRDGLRILEEDEDDEHIIEPVEFKECRDIDSLVKKRKFELQDDASNQVPAHRQNATMLIGENKHLRPQREVVESHHWRNASPTTSTKTIPRTAKYGQGDRRQTYVRGEPTPQQDRDTGLMFGGRFSATGALDSFMTLHGMTAKPKRTEKEALVTNKVAESALPLPTRLSKEVRNNDDEAVRGDAKAGVEAGRRPPELSPLPKDLPPCSFVISSALLQRRGLSRQVEKLYPKAEFVSRDFDSRHMASGEADVILSPCTGLILTTLQQLKQRALPGEPDRSPVKERMKALQGMYERVVMLISEGLSSETEGQGSNTLDHRDRDAIREHENLASHMGGEILIHYVPGGEQSLAHQMVMEMAKYGLAHGSRDIGDIKLLPDQTTWEVFLRRAGLNAFAAQVILALLKDAVEWPQSSYDTTDMESDAVRTCGLQTFLFMSAEQRVQNFQAILGGSRVLSKVSALLDEPWLSAAHGFRM